MKSVSNASLLFTATVIYTIGALLLPVVSELWLYPVIRLRVVPGEVDALESTVRWPIVALLIVVASVIPALLLSIRFSKLKLLVFSLVVAVLGEIFITLFLLWLSAHPPVGDYPILHTIRNLNSSNRWPYEADWHLVFSLLRIGILPLVVAGIALISQVMLTKSPFGKNLKSAVN